MLDVAVVSETPRTKAELQLDLCLCAHPMATTPLETWQALYESVDITVGQKLNVRRRHDVRQFRLARCPVTIPVNAIRPFLGPTGTTSKRHVPEATPSST